MAMSRDRDKEAFWRLVLQKHTGLGLAIHHFCPAECLSESLFCAWRPNFFRIKFLPACLSSPRKV